MGVKSGFLQIHTAKNQAERMPRIADCDSGGAYSFLAGLRSQQARPRRAGASEDRPWMAVRSGA